jgi:hypothetical protein
MIGFHPTRIKELPSALHGVFHLLTDHEMGHGADES